MLTPDGKVYLAVPVADPSLDEGFDAKALVMVEKAVFYARKVGFCKFRVVAEFFISLGLVPSC